MKAVGSTTRASAKMSARAAPARRKTRATGGASKLSSASPIGMTP